MDISCKPTVDLVADHSFGLEIKGVEITGNTGIWKGSETIREDLVWSYSLLPETPLDVAVNIPVPQVQRETVDMNTVIDLAGLALSIIQVLVALY